MATVYTRVTVAGTSANTQMVFCLVMALHPITLVSLAPYVQTLQPQATVDEQPNNRSYIKINIVRTYERVLLRS